MIIQKNKTINISANSNMKTTITVDIPEGYKIIGIVDAWSGDDYCVGVDRYESSNSINTKTYTINVRNALSNSVYVNAYISITAINNS